MKKAIIKEVVTELRKEEESSSKGKINNVKNKTKLKRRNKKLRIAKIKEAVYNPDQGLYARLRELETWKSTSSKMIWTLFTSVVGLIGAFILKNIGQ